MYESEVIRQVANNVRRLGGRRLVKPLPTDDRVELGFFLAIDDAVGCQPDSGDRLAALGVTQFSVAGGGATLEAMLAFAARQAGATGGHRRRGWTVTVGWFRAPREYRAKVYRADVARTTEHAHPSDPAEALARALLAAVTGSAR